MFHFIDRRIELNLPEKIIMIRKWLSMSCLSLLVASLVATTASADVLSNGGFELGTGSLATDWTAMVGPNGTAGRSSSSPNAGSFGAYIEFDNLNNSAAGAAYFIEQNLGANTIDSTKNYSLSFHAKTDTNDFTGVDVFYQILWLDQDGSDGGGVKGEILTELVGLGINTNYQLFEANDLDVPDAADSFLIRFQVSAGAVDGIVQGLYVDNASLSAVPEPTTFGLVAVMGVLTVCRRRRRV